MAFADKVLICKSSLKSTFIHYAWALMDGEPEQLDRKRGVQELNFCQVVQSAF